MNKFFENFDSIIKIYFKNKKSIKKTYSLSKKQFPGLDIEFSLFEKLVKHGAAVEDKTRALSLELEVLKKAFERLSEELKDSEEDKREFRKELSSASSTIASFDKVVTILRSTKNLPASVLRILDEDLPKSGLMNHNFDKPTFIAGWNVQYSNGYFRAFRQSDKKAVGVHIGREINVKMALKKIRKKEAQEGLEPLDINDRDLAYKLIAPK